MAIPRAELLLGPLSPLGGDWCPSEDPAETAECLVPVMCEQPGSVVSYRVPHNAAVQVYDYREKKAR